MPVIGIDWGGTSFRASLFSDSDEVIDRHQSASGLRSVLESSGRHFRDVVQDEIGHWIQPGDTILLSGMVTSQQGWQETPYIECPAELDQLLTQAVRQKMGSATLIFLPGMCQRQPHADVMRGEELQLLGSVSSLADHEQQQCVVMPGTHSKWVRMRGRQVLDFQTVMTGELFDVLRKHTVVGLFARDGEYLYPSTVKKPGTAFLEGVHQGVKTRTLISDLFASRAEVLLGERSREDVSDWLSGLLLGHEIQEATGHDRPSSLRLVGAPALCERYRLALVSLGFSVPDVTENAAEKGFAALLPSLKEERS